MKLIYIILCLILINCGTHKEQTKINNTVIESYQFSFKKKHQLNNNLARRKAEELANSLRKHGLTWKWEGNNIIFDVESGLVKGSNGTLSILPDTIKLNIKGIPSHLLIFTPIIINKVNSRLDFYFN